MIKGEKSEKRNPIKPQLVKFTGKVFGQIDLNEVEKQNDLAMTSLKTKTIRVRRGVPVRLHERSSQLRGVPVRSIRLNDLLRGSIPTKRILFNEIGSRHNNSLIYGGNLKL